MRQGPGGGSFGSRLCHPRGGGVHPEALVGTRLCHPRGGGGPGGVTSGRPPSRARRIAQNGHPRRRGPGGGTCGYPPLSPLRRQGSRRSHVWAPAFAGATDCAERSPVKGVQAESPLGARLRGRDGLRRTATREGGPGGDTCGYPPLSPPRRRGSRRSRLWAPASPFGMRSATKRDTRARRCLAGLSRRTDP